MFDRVSLENTRFSPRSLNMNSIIIDSMQQRKFEVHTPFRFEAVDPGTKTAREWATYASMIFPGFSCSCYHKYAGTKCLPNSKVSFKQQSMSAAMIT